MSKSKYDFGEATSSMSLVDSIGEPNPVIDCGNGRTVQFGLYADAYKLYLAATHHPSVEGKTGDAFVEAILKVKNNGINSRWLNSNFKNDGPNGEPCYVEFFGDNRDNHIRIIGHYESNQIVSRQTFYENGQTAEMEYFKGRKPFNGPNGEPGIRRYFPGGQLREEEFFDEAGHSVQNKTFYESGKLKSVTISENGVMMDSKSYHENGELLWRRWRNNSNESLQVQQYDQSGSGILLYQNGVRMEVPTAPKEPGPIKRGIKSALLRVMPK